MNESAIKTSGLTKYYRRQPVVDHLDIVIPKGSICGFLGRNGAGKTTTIKMLLGFTNPTAGCAEVLGCDSTCLTPEIRKCIGYVTEGHRLFRWMTIKGLENFQKSFFLEQWDGRFFNEMLEYFELSPQKKIKHLSNGQRAQVSLALTLAPRPELLIMDDPTLGLDVVVRRQFLDGMIALIVQEGRTVLFSSHILEDVERVCDRILVLDKGVLRANCTVSQFRQEIKKVEVQFEHGVPGHFDIEGLIQQRVSSHRIEMILVGTSKEEIDQWMVAHEASQYAIVPLTLEEQFIAFTTTQKSRKLFRWEGIQH